MAVKASGIPSPTASVLLHWAASSKIVCGTIGGGPTSLSAGQTSGLDMTKASVSRTSKKGGDLNKLGEFVSRDIVLRPAARGCVCLHKST